MVDGSVVTKQGIRFVFSDGSRIIFCLLGTGSVGATAEIYIEQFEPEVSKHQLDAQIALKPLIDVSKPNTSREGRGLQSSHTKSMDDSGRLFRPALNLSY